MNPLHVRLLLEALSLSIPLIFAASALFVRRVDPLGPATWVSRITLLLAFATAVGSALGQSQERAIFVRFDAATRVVLPLVGLLAFIIVRYSRTYLQGDPGLPRYTRWLLATLSAVTSLVLANHLVMMALAWTATSLALHQLLTFYEDRPAALVAAHKKFLVSRLADVCLWIALALLHANVGSLRLDALETWTRAHGALSPTMEIAALLVVAAACLKSAQLPFHGWLTQVMEAPTPVSALLHAGIVNLGGIAMIRFAPLLRLAPLAQLALVLVGLTTTVLASLIMTTRVSVKVALAWSTIAQMGFMLVECGLGWWHLALLHLVAHSLYKAHAFLNAGTAVDAYRRAAQAPALPRLTPGRLAASAFIVSLVAGGALLLLARAGSFDASALTLAVLLGLSVVPLLARARTTRRAWLFVALRGAGLLLAFGLAHAAAERFLITTQAPDASWLLHGLVSAGLLALFAVQAALELLPEGRFARALHPRLFAGLFLDERFTRLTFRVWPPSHRAPPLPLLTGSEEVS